MLTENEKNPQLFAPTDPIFQAEMTQNRTGSSQKCIYGHFLGGIFDAYFEGNSMPGRISFKFVKM